MHSLLIAGNKSFSEKSDFQLLQNKINEISKFSKVILLASYEFPRTLEAEFPNIVIEKVPPGTKGALATAAFGLSHLGQSKPFLIIPSNATIANNEIENFSRKMSAEKSRVGAISFRSSNPLFSYARLDLGEEIVEIVEKKVFGSCALAGVYWFDEKETFANCIEWSMVNNIQNNNNFFISPALNYFLANSITITLFEILESQYSRDLDVRRGLHEHI